MKKQFDLSVNMHLNSQISKANYLHHDDISVILWGHSSTMFHCELQWTDMKYDEYDDQRLARTEKRKDKFEVWKDDEKNSQGSVIKIFLIYLTQWSINLASWSVDFR